MALARNCAKSLAVGVELNCGSPSAILCQEHFDPTLILASGRKIASVSRVATIKLIIPFDGEWLYRRVPHWEQNTLREFNALTSKLASSVCPSMTSSLLKGIITKVVKAAP